MSSLLDFGAHGQVLIWMFALAVVLGAVTSKTNFCTMGAVSDWLNMGDTGRMRAWLFAIAIAVLGVTAIEAASVASLRANTMPPYRTENFAWLRYIVGGLIFGIGMTLGSGCGTKTLLRIGGGNLKSIFVATAIATVVYFMFTTRLFEISVTSWVGPTVVSLAEYGLAGQGIDDFLAKATGLNATTARLLAGAAIGAALLWYVFKSADFRGNRDNILGGAAVGLAVVGGWYVTAGPLGVEWVEEAIMDGEPNRAAVQSFTFISPIGEAGRYLLDPTNLGLVRVGVVTVFGVILGAFLYALFTRSFRFEWFSSPGDFFLHLTGGLLMGYGGFVAMGCTVGQGVSGVSTLALGSFLALGGMIAGSALTMKIQFALMD
jgi:uncharacterized membrane protein YedE/YeeE